VRKVACWFRLLVVERQSVTKCFYCASE